VSVLQFPDGFDWGCAASAYQTEGAWDEGGRGESIWDRFCHAPGHIKNGDTGDIACDQYHRYPEDVALMQELGLKTFRFSVSWPRVFPQGKGAASEKGLDFYDRLVDELLAAGISPLANLYHFDLPQALEDEGGWTNRRTAYHFADYCAAVVDRLGDRVKRWVIFNEPFIFTWLAYSTGAIAPGIRDSALALRSVHVVSLAQGLAARAIRDRGSAEQVGTAFSMNGAYPETESEEDKAAAERAHRLGNAWFLESVQNGRYPELPGVDEEKLGVQPGDMELVKAPLDFAGVNLYTRMVVAHNPSRENFGVRIVVVPDVERTDNGWEVYPEAIHQAIMRTWNDYRLPIWVTENGCAINDGPDSGGNVNDDRRISYLQRYLAQVGRAINEGADVRGYHVWTLLDNFEWLEGYSQRFGLVYVDFPSQRRIIKKSGRWYRDLIAANRLEI
jgi:beta-glucosidase